jgi:urocanate hydratase
MSEIHDEASAKARREIERLQSENSKLKEEWLELSDEMLSFTGLPGHLHRLDVKMKELKSLLVRAADALERGRSETPLQLVQELRKAAE